MILLLQISRLGRLDYYLLAYDTIMYALILQPASTYTIIHFKLVPSMQNLLVVLGSYNYLCFCS